MRSNYVTLCCITLCCIILCCITLCQVNVHNTPIYHIGKLVWHYIRVMCFWLYRQGLQHCLLWISTYPLLSPSPPTQSWLSAYFPGWQPHTCSLAAALSILNLDILVMGNIEENRYRYSTVTLAKVSIVSILVSILRYPSENPHYKLHIHKLVMYFDFPTSNFLGFFDICPISRFFSISDFYLFIYLFGIFGHYSNAVMHKWQSRIFIVTVTIGHSQESSN